MKVPWGTNRWVIVLAVLIALVLAVYPLPQALRWWRPEFVLLVMIYWSLVLPANTSLTLLWCLGVVQDLILGNPLGLSSLGLVVVGYVCIQSYQRVLNYALWQQACWVFVLAGISQTVVNWVHTLSGSQAAGLSFLYPALTSALLWPLVYRGFEKIRLLFSVS